jgi:hypothetical protein
MTDAQQPTPRTTATSAPELDQDLVPEDDAVIGRAFRWSLLVIALAAAGLALAAWLGRGTEPEAAPVIDKPPPRIESLPDEAGTIPQLHFTNVTSAAGIDFDRFTGAVGEKLLPETMGSGAAFLDFDADGDQDLLLVNSCSWPWEDLPEPVPTQALLRNRGDGTFEDVTDRSGLDVMLYGMGVACGDYDADGLVDVCITGVGGNRLFRNAGGSFEDATLTAGLGDDGSGRWSTSAGFFDFDRDGDLDLFVCSYVRWSREIDLRLAFTLNGVDRAYGPPTTFEGTDCVLYQNRGDGTFADVSRQAGLGVRNPATGVPVGKALGLVFLDVDEDGWLDVLVANDTTANFVFVNQRDGTFAERGTELALAFDSMGRATGAMGVDAAHYRSDADLAVAIGNFANEMTSFYVRQGRSSQFSDDAIPEGLGSPTRVVLSFGLFFFDADLDGRLDLLQANGHLEPEINQVQPGQHYRQRTQLFWNRGAADGPTYTEVPAERTGDLARPIVGRGATCADIDADGDVDVLLTQANGPPLLLRNDRDNANHWLRVRLVGAGANRDAIGARVELTAAGRTQRRLLSPARSYLCSTELPLTFGLGTTQRVEALVVHWPLGGSQRVEVEGVDRVIEVVQGQAPGNP